MKIPQVLEKRKRNERLSNENPAGVAINFVTHQKNPFIMFEWALINFFVNTTVKLNLIF